MAAHQPGSDRIGVALPLHLLPPRGGQAGQAALQRLPGGVQVGPGGIQRLGLLQHPVPHGQLQGLVGRAVRVGDHMQPDHPAGQLRLLPLQPRPGEQGTQQSKHQT